MGQGRLSLRHWLALVLVLGSSACEQSEQTSSVECADCIELASVGRLYFTDLPTLPSPGGLLARGPNGGFAFVDQIVPYEVLIFDNFGRYVRTLGREGEGPGEYDRITAIAIDSSGGLWVMSRRGRRLDRYGTDLEEATEVPLPSQVFRLAPLEGGAMLAVSMQAGTAEIGIISAEGAYDRVDVTLPPGTDPTLLQIATDRQARFWIAEPNRFGVWTGEVGGPVTLLTDEAPEWFASRYSDEMLSVLGLTSRQGGTTVLALEYEPTANILWLTSGVPAPTMEPSGVRPILEGADMGTIGALADRLADHVVLGLDPLTGAKKAERRFNFLAVATTSPMQYGVSDSTTVEVLTPQIR